MHDDQQVVRLFELDQALAVGQFPVRWVKNLGFGYGYPLFNFYPPLVYYLGEIFHLGLGTGYIDSVKLVFGFTFVGAAVSMYLWSKNHFGKLPAVIASIFYSYAPYHAVDAYVRGALAELTAFVWLPLIFLTADRLMLKKQPKYWLWLGIFLALLMITHNLIFLPFFALLVIYTFFLFIQTKEKSTFVRNLIFSIIIGMGLSAFFWLPALTEKQYTLVDSVLLSDLAKYELHFVEPAQLWNSLWGFGGSTLGSLDGLSFKLGKLHIVFSIVAVCFVFFHKEMKVKLIKSTRIIVIAVFILFVFSVFMTTAYSRSLWMFFSPLQFLQFPWRFLTFASLFSSFLVGVVVFFIEKKVNKHLITGLLAASIILLVIMPNLKYFQPQQYLNVNDSYYTNTDFIKWNISKTSFEFVPKYVETISEYNPIEKQTIKQLNLAKEDVGTDDIKVIEGSVKTSNFKRHPDSIDFNLTTETASTIRLPSFYFPGWHVKVNGELHPIKSDNPLHLIELELKTGEYDIQARFTDTKIRRIANLLSSLFILLLIFAIIKKKNYQRETSNK
jgi:hypothetical protein